MADQPAAQPGLLDTVNAALGNAPGAAPGKPLQATPPPSITAEQPAVAASEALPQAPSAPIPGAPQQSQGMWSRIVDGAKNLISNPVDTAEGIGAGIARAPGIAIGGALDTAADAVSEIPGVSQGAAHRGVASVAGSLGIAPYLLTQTMAHGASFEDVLSARDTLGKVGNNDVNQATANIASLALGSWELKAAGLITRPGIIGGALRFGAASGILTPSGATGERFSNALNALGVGNEFTQWLGADDDDAGPLEARFKNALDGTLTGAAFDSVFATAKWAYASFKGAAPAVVDAAKQEAQDAAEKLAPGIAAPGDSLKTAKVSMRASTAAELTESGAPAAATGGEADSSKVAFTAKTAGDEKARVVGTMDKGDLTTFQANAAKYAGLDQAALDVTPEGSPELYQGIGQIKPSLMQSPDDVAPFLRAVLDDAPAITRPMSDEDLNTLVAQGAQHLGVDQNAMMAFAQNVAKESSQLPQAVGIIRAHWEAVATALRKDAKTGTAGIEEGSPELQSKLENLFTARSFSAHVIDIKAGLGRGLRAWQLPTVTIQRYAEKLFGKPDGLEELPSSIDPSGQMPPLPRNLSELSDFYDLIKVAGDDNGALQDNMVGRNLLPSPSFYARSSIANFFTGSLLAGKALVKGVVMPAFMGAIQTMERTTAAGTMALNPLLSAADRQTFAAIAKATPLAYFQTMGDMKAALEFSLQAVKQGGQTIIGGGYSAKDAAQRLGPVTDAMLRAAQTPGDWRYNLGNAINLWPKAVFSLVGGHDELTKRLAYLGQVRMRAAYEAMSSTEGPASGVTFRQPIPIGDASDKPYFGQGVQDYIKQSLSAAVDPSTAAATNPDVLDEAARTSFINQPDGPMADAISTLNRARNMVPELRLILPVLNVPANALGEAIRRVPLLSYAFQGTRDALKGDLGKIAQAEAYGRWLTGASTLGVGYALARNSQLTGYGPSNAADREIWLQDHQPYSIKVFGHWVSYKEWEPLGGMLGMIGTGYDHTVYSPEDSGTRNKTIAAVAGLAEYMKDKSAMQQVADILNFGGDPTSNPTQALTRIAGSTAAGFVPAFVHYLRNLNDPVMRRKNSVADYIMDSIPTQSQHLDPMRNVLGEPIHVPNDTLLENTLPITIAKTSPDNADPVTEELDHVYQVSGYAGGVTHPSELGHSFFDPRTVQLEDGRSMYDRFVRDRLAPNPDSDQGGSVRQQLDALFKSQDYKDAAYGSATTQEDALGQPSRLGMIAKTFQLANTHAKQQMAQDSPIARRMLAIVAAKKDSPGLLRGYDVPTLITQPGLFKSLGINLSDYADKVQGQ